MIWRAYWFHGFMIQCNKLNSLLDIISKDRIQSSFPWEKGWTLISSCSLCSLLVWSLGGHRSTLNLVAELWYKSELDIFWCTISAIEANRNAYSNIVIQARKFEPRLSDTSELWFLTYRFRLKINYSAALCLSHEVFKRFFYHLCHWTPYHENKS